MANFISLENLLSEVESDYFDLCDRSDSSESESECEDSVEEHGNQEFEDFNATELTEEGQEAEHNEVLQAAPRTADDDTSEFNCSCTPSCFDTIDLDSCRNQLAYYKSLSKDQLDLVILGKISVMVNTSDTLGPGHKHKRKNRERTRCTYSYEGQSREPTMIVPSHPMVISYVHNLLVL